MFYVLILDLRKTQTPSNDFTWFLIMKQRLYTIAKFILKFISLVVPTMEYNFILDIELSGNQNKERIEEKLVLLNCI